MHSWIIHHHIHHLFVDTDALHACIVDHHPSSIVINTNANPNAFAWIINHDPPSSTPICMHACMHHQPPSIIIDNNANANALQFAFCIALHGSSTTVSIIIEADSHACMGHQP
jgi:hypothetical protein